MGFFSDILGRRETPPPEARLSSGRVYHALPSSPADHPVIRIAQRLPGYSGMSATGRHRVQLELYHSLRELVPVLHDAISKRRQIEGTPYIESKNEELKSALQAFADEVPVGYVRGASPSKGLPSYIRMLAENADEYGLGFGEPVLSGPRGREIERLVVPEPRTFTFELENTEPRLYYDLYQYQNGKREKLGGARVQLLSFAPDPASPWPRPMAWGLPFVAELLIRVVLSTNNGWMRFGDPMSLWLLLYEAGVTPTVQAGQTDPNIQNLITQLTAVWDAKKQGKTGDAVFGGSGLKDIKRENLADVDNSLVRWMPEQWQVIAPQIWSRSSLPSWMMPGANLSGAGMNSDRFEQEALAAEDAASDRRVSMTGVLKEVLDLQCLILGRPEWAGQYEIAWKATSVTSEKYKEDTRKVRAEADTAFIEASYQLFPEDSQEVDDPDADPEDPDAEPVRVATGMSDERRAYLERHGVLEPTTVK